MILIFIVAGFPTAVQKSSSNLASCTVCHFCVPSFSVCNREPASCSDLIWAVRRYWYSVTQFVFK